MHDSRSASTTLLTFAGAVLVIAVLYWARAVLMPMALAALLAFVLAGPVTRLQRWVGRTIAVALTVTLVFAALAAAGWGLSSQLSRLADDLPSYRTNIREKIRDVRRVGDGPVEKLQDTFEDIRSEIDQTARPRTRTATGVVNSQEPFSIWAFPTWLSPLMGPLSTAGLVVILVVFMLLEREQLRGKLIGLLGSGHLALTTKAFDEAGQRVSRQLLMQTLVNAIYGVCVAVGLYLLDVPYPLLFGAIGAALRYIPYLGPCLAAGLPLLVSLAALPGWAGALWVLGLFVVLETFTNMVLETVLYADAAGVSQVALIIAVAFWTWVWGPIGLLLATPLTVCVVVIGRHLPGLELLSELMSDAPALRSDVAFYQRILARDHSEAAELMEKYVTTERADAVYDGLLVPALTYGRRDRMQDRLSPEEEVGTIDITRELLADAAALNRAARSEGAVVQNAPAAFGRGDQATFAVAAYAATGPADEVAIRMLEQLLDGSGVRLEMVPPQLLASEIASWLTSKGHRVICLVDLPPSRPSKARYLVKRLRAALPEVTIVVCRWAGPDFVADDAATFLDAGANHVSTSLTDARSYLRGHAPVMLSAAVPARSRDRSTA
jgi:predicted PurR-regulated permease PerM